MYIISIIMGIYNNNFKHDTLLNKKEGEHNRNNISQGPSVYRYNIV